MKKPLHYFGPGFSANKFILQTFCFADEGGEGGGGAAVLDAPPSDASPDPEPNPAPGERKPLASLAEGFAKLNGKALESTFRPGDGKITIPTKKQDDPPANDPDIKPSGDAPAAPPVKKAEPVSKKPIEGLADPSTLVLPEAKGKASESWKKVHGELTNAHAIIHKERARISELETALASEKTKYDEDRKKINGELETLRPFRAVTDEQNTPEFQEKYDKPISDAQKEMGAILKRLKIKDEEFTKFLPNVESMQSIATQLSEGGFKTEARLLENRIEKMADAQLKRDQAIEDFKANHSKIVEGRKAELTAKQVQQSSKSKSYLEAQWSNKTDKDELKYPFFNEVKIAPDATEEQKAQANEYNDSVKGMREKMHEWLGIDTPEHKSELVLGTMLAAVYSHQLQTSNARVKSLEAELAKITKSGSAPRSPNPNRDAGGTLKTGSSLVDGFRSLNGRNS